MRHVDYSRPELERRVVITYKNMPVAHHVSHIGLGVSALQTAKVLQQNGIACDVWPILGAKDLAARIADTKPQPSHVVIGAPWIPTLDLQAYLVFRFPLIQFSVVCHSNVGFLQNDPTAIKNFREDLDLEQGALNFRAGGNSKRFANWIMSAYGRPCIWLPNLYYLDNGAPTYRSPYRSGLLKIGSFGAVRSLKNHLSAAAAVLEIANDLHTDIDFHISVGRVEHGNSVVRAIDAMLGSVPGIKLIKDEWYRWPQFRFLVRSMNLLMQPSYTETFNMVTADGAAESIPSVVSDAIEWTPSYWQADVDDPLDIARIGKALLTNMHAGADGFNALKAHNAAGVLAWKAWLEL
jgi:hypothetical protein